MNRSPASLSAAKLSFPPGCFRISQIRSRVNNRDEPPGYPFDGCGREENFQAAKGLAGPDEHQVRRWDSRYRWTTLAMLAPAFLTITAATEHTRPPPGDQIPLSRNEVATLFSTLIIDPVTDTTHRLRWSAWWRRHQRRAKTCHYQRQARQP